MFDPHQQGLPFLAIKPFRDVFVFAGRSTRTETGFCIWLMALLFGALDSWFVSIGTPAALVGQWLVVAFAVLPLFALMARRAHDLDKPGWIGCVGVLALIGMAWLSGQLPGQPFAASSWLESLSGLAVVLALWTLTLAPPTPGANRYGPDPRSEAQTKPA